MQKLAYVLTPFTPVWGTRLCLEQLHELSVRTGLPQDVLVAPTLLRRRYLRQAAAAGLTTAEDVGLVEDVLSRLGDGARKNGRLVKRRRGDRGGPPPRGEAPPLAP